ncbi:MAG: cohesin domain-containing protein [Candidatus Yanofskybacteria bacterium]|nr:cohesin domain-containing protein [Candidatus Yanofskybacteria bacterium]
MERVIHIAMKKLNLLLVSLVVSAIMPTITHAAYIYFEPASANKAVGERFTVNVRLNTEGESINAIDLGILYPPVLRAVSVSKAGSALQLWVQDPSFTGTSIIFTGGSPGGIQSGSALIGKITFEGKAAGEGGFGLTGDSSALLNDGQGTKAALRLINSVFSIGPRSAQSPGPSVKPGQINEPAETPESPASKQEKTDTKKPSRFDIAVGTDPRVFGGKKFVSFFTTDAETGVDHYEVKEGSGVFRVARTPYLLGDEPRTVVRVRAYDGAGNYREEAYPGIFRRILWWIINIF